MNRATLIGGLFGTVAAVLTGFPMADALDRLGDARARYMAEAARLDAPPPTGREPFRFQAADANRARAMIAARVRRLAAANDVLVETMRAAPPGGPGLAGIELRLSGQEKAVLIVADAIEREGGAIRWQEWRLTAPATGAARIEGRVIGAWR